MKTKEKTRSKYTNITLEQKNHVICSTSHFLYFWSAPDATLPQQPKKYILFDIMTSIVEYVLKNNWSERLCK